MSFGVFAALIIFAFTSCREDKAKTETIIIEKPVEKPKAEEKDGTSISVDGDGVEFSTQSGNNKTEVKIK